MAVDEVEEVDAEPLQRAVDGLHQVLAVERVDHVGNALDAPEELGGQHDSWIAAIPVRE